MTNAWWPRRIQGAYYVATGLWPVLAIDHYMAATGQERHGRVAQLLGAAVAGFGVALAADALPPRIARAASIGVALTLAGGAAVFAAQGRGVPVNLTDGAVQLVFAAAWALGGRVRRNR